MLGISESKNQLSEEAAVAAMPRIVPVEPSAACAVIGPSIFIKGDLSGDEDVVIQGRVEGKINLKENAVTVDKNGRVKADVYGKHVTVEGEVEGNLSAQDQIVVRSSGRVRGNLSAPRVLIEDGARFKGSIDMDSKFDRPGTHVAAESKSALSAISSAQTHKAGLSLRTETGSTKAG
jgi:cytoskeletal protein CcmA (bactofilin family)